MYVRETSFFSSEWVVEKVHLALQSKDLNRFRGETNKGYLQLNHDMVCKIAPSSMSYAKRNVFGIFDPHDKLVLLMSATSPEQMDEWITTLNKCIQSY